MGGRLGAFLPQWEEISSSQFNLRTIKEGYYLEFSSSPPNRFYTTRLPKNRGKARGLMSAITDLRKQGVIIKVPREEKGQGFYSHIFGVQKPSGKVRPILNLKPLNLSITYKRFRMDSIYSVKALLPPSCYMVSLDLKDAYLHIPIHQNCQKFLRLAIETGKETLHLQFRALPFGLSSSPIIFTKILAEALAPLRLKGISIIAYLDDLLLFADSPGRLLENLEYTRKFLESLGWLISVEKSNLQPTQQIKYLGYIIDSVQQRIFQPKEKIEKIQREIKRIQTNLPCSIRKIMSTLGLLTSAIPAVQWASLHFRPLQMFLLKIWDHKQESLDTQVFIPAGVKKTLWW